MEDFLDINVLIKALTIRAAKKVSDTMIKLESSKASNKEKENSLYGTNIVSMTHSHLILVTVQLWENKVRDYKFKDPRIRFHLDNLTRIYILNELIQDSVPLYETGYFGAGISDLLMTAT